MQVYYREKPRRSAERSLGLLHPLVRARGELDRDDICERLGTDPGQQLSRWAGAVFLVTTTLKDEGDVATSRADVLVSERKGRRAGSNGVTHVHVRAELVTPLRSQARPFAQAQQPTSGGAQRSPRGRPTLQQPCLASAPKPW